jgi:hypothetical protein
MEAISRRTFLILAPAAAAAGASLLSVSGSLRNSFAANEAGYHGDELVAMVEEYLRNFPEERDIAKLYEILGVQSDTTGDRSFASAPTVLRRIEQDFAEERTVSLAGWILSRTESRVLALLTLLGR